MGLPALFIEFQVFNPELPDSGERFVGSDRIQGRLVSEEGGHFLESESFRVVPVEHGRDEDAETYGLEFFPIRDLETDAPAFPVGEDAGIRGETTGVKVTPGKSAAVRSAASFSSSM